MDIAGIFELFNLITVLLGTIVGNQPKTQTALALEAIALKAIQLYQAESGQPLDMTKLRIQDRIE